MIEVENNKFNCIIFFIYNAIFLILPVIYFKTYFRFKLEISQLKIYNNWTMMKH